eukprot:9376924-Ditylum_brightwellii.AAC.1
MDSFMNSINVVKHSYGIIGEYPKFGKYTLCLDGNKATRNITLITSTANCSSGAYLDEYPKMLIGAQMKVLLLPLMALKGRTMIKNVMRKFCRKKKRWL